MKLCIIYSELGDQVIAPPTLFYILAPNTFLCSHISLCYFGALFWPQDKHDTCLEQHHVCFWGGLYVFLTPPPVTPSNMLVVNSKQDWLTQVLPGLPQSGLPGSFYRRVRM